MATGTVFDIKEFTVHDGPGPRVTVFLKGCPLHCKWCHNPEGISEKPQLMIKRNKCVNCGLCKKNCTHEICHEFGRCIYACPRGLISIAGKRYTSQELAIKLESYMPFFKDGGGVTFSGGEPLLQSNFVISVCKRIPNIHKALQTCGYAQKQVFQEVLKYVDYVLFDLKLIDSETHKKYTGVYNDCILENYQWLKKSGKPYVVRVPLIPGITDTKENLEKIASITDGDKVELLKYNQLAGVKYNWIGETYALNRLEQKDISVPKSLNAIIVG